MRLWPEQASDSMWAHGRLFGRMGEPQRMRKMCPPDTLASQGLDLGQANHSPRNGPLGTFQLHSPPLPHAALPGLGTTPKNGGEAPLEDPGCLWVHGWRWQGVLVAGARRLYA